MSADSPQIQMLPVCPYCGADPAPIIPAFTQFGTGRVTVFMCANPKCRRIHSVQLTDIMEPPKPLVEIPR